MARLDNNRDRIYRLDSGQWIVLDHYQHKSWPGWVRFTFWAIAGLGTALIATWLAGGI